tara:strand:- start:361 stop:675 length:315 start_codon:yes stop_codon:yes gene_type:complete
MITTWITLIGIFTNKIQIKLDNIYMTDDEINKIAQKVSELVLEGIIQSELVSLEDEETEEQLLLTQLAQAMTELDYNLKKENYSQCERIKNRIAVIENKLNKFK